MVEERNRHVEPCSRGPTKQGAAVEAIDVHVHIVPQRFVDLVRGGALAEIVDVTQAPAVDRLTFQPPAGIVVEPDTAIRPHLYDPQVILAAMDRRKLDAAAVSPPP